MSDPIVTKTEPAASVTSGGAAGAGSAGSTPASASPSPPSYHYGGKEYGSVEDLGKAYESLQSEHGRWTQQFGDLRRQYGEAATMAQKWNEWWQSVAPFWGQDVEDLLQRKATSATPTGAQGTNGPAATAGATAFDGFEGLRPDEQAGRLRDVVSSQLTADFNRRLGEALQAVNTTLQQREQWYQKYITNHLGLMRKALEQKLRDPTFDVDAVMDQAAKAMGGQIDPIQLGQQLLSAAQMQSKVEAARKSAYDQGRKDVEQEMVNKKLETVPSAGAGAPKYKIPQGKFGTKHGLGTLRESAAEALAKKFGPSIFAEG